MIGWVILGVYLVAYLAAIHPIYSALLRAEAKRTYSTMQASDITFAALAASTLALVWPLGLPFWVSRWLHTHRTHLSVDEEIETAKAAVQAETRRRAALKAAAREVDLLDYSTDRRWA